MKCYRFTKSLQLHLGSINLIDLINFSSDYWNTHKSKVALHTQVNQNMGQRYLYLYNTINTIKAGKQRALQV